MNHKASAGVPPAFDPARLDAAFTAVARQVSDGEVPVAVLGIARREGVVRVEAFERPDGDRAKSDSVFLVASITKPVVAAAILQLVEGGRLSLSTPLRAYLPEFNPAPPGANLPVADLVTVQHLLSHSSGIVEPGEIIQERASRRDQLLADALRAPLRFMPGTRFDYATITFYLLGELIRRISGLDYPEYIRQRILEPLGMVDSTFDPVAEVGLPERITWPHFQGIGVVPEDAVARWFISIAHPGAGLWSTAEDLLRFGRAMLGGGSLDGARIMGSRFVELMTREQTAMVLEEGVVPRDPTYGLGWGLPGLDGSLPVSSHAFGHGGATGTRLLIDPDADLVVVYLTNVWGASDRHGLEAIGAVFGALDD